MPREVPDGAMPVSGSLEKRSKIKMRVHKTLIRGDAVTIRDHRFPGPAEILVRNAEIERGGGMQCVAFECVLIKRQRFRQLAFFVQQPSEIDQRVGMMGIDGESLHVGIARIARRDGFELDSELEPFVSGKHALAV